MRRRRLGVAAAIARQSPPRPGTGFCPRVNRVSSWPKAEQTGHQRPLPTEAGAPHHQESSRQWQVERGRHTRRRGGWSHRTCAFPAPQPDCKSFPPIDSPTGHSRPRSTRGRLRPVSTRIQRRRRWPSALQSQSSGAERLQSGRIRWRQTKGPCRPNDANSLGITQTPWPFRGAAGRRRAHGRARPCMSCGLDSGPCLATVANRRKPHAGAPWRPSTPARNVVGSTPDDGKVATPRLGWRKSTGCEATALAASLEGQVGGPRSSAPDHRHRWHRPGCPTWRRCARWPPAPFKSRVAPVGWDRSPDLLLCWRLNPWASSA